MLRTKPISTLSCCVRSFLISGSRLSAADGSSCICADDEKSASRKQQTRNEYILPQKLSTLVSRTSSGVRTLLSGGAAKVTGCCDSENVIYPSSSLPQVLCAPHSLGNSDGVTSVRIGVDDIQSDVLLPSPLVSDQFVKLGIAAVGFLSDLVNYRLALSDGTGIYRSTQNFMVNPTVPNCSVKSANGKPAKKGNFSKFNRKQQFTENVTPGPEANRSNNYHGTGYKGDKSSSVKGFIDMPKNGMGNPVGTYNLSSGNHEKERSIPQMRGATHNHFTPNINSYARISEVKVGGGITGGFNRQSRDAGITVGFVSRARQPANTGDAVGTVSCILRQLKWGLSSEEALKKLNCSIDAYQANQVLKQLKDHLVALGFFHWLKQQSGFKHDEHTYTTMVGILGRARQFGSINKLLEEMVRDGFQPNVVTYNRLIHSYGRANYLHEAVNVFNQMQEAGCAPDRVTYCTLIDIHAKAGYLDVAMCMYQRMQEAGLSPDTFTYSVIINGLGKAGYLTAAHKLFCQMVNQGCAPNLVTYNTMITLQAKARNYPSALKLYHDMKTAGFEPDKVTYSIVMEVLGHCGYLEEVEGVFVEMKQKNWVPDEPVYGLLVDLWGKTGNVEKAWTWYQAMLNDGLRPNVPTCNSLLSAFLRVHRLPDAYNLLESMLALGLSPSLQTYTLLLSCCTDAQVPFEMRFCCQLMAITGHPAHMFLLSMPPAGPDGQNVRDHMSYFLDLIHSEDRESKRGLVDALVDFLHKSGLKEEAGSVWEVAAQRNVYPEAVKEKSSCYWLINLHVMSDGTAVTALSRTLAWFRKRMLVSGIGPGRIDIVTGWGRRSRVTGTSLVRQAVQELLNVFSFPFFAENGNSGCFVGQGEPLRRWLLQSYVERMHLL